MTKELEYLKAIVQVLAGQYHPAVSNQGQCLDGYSALANYNDIAEKISKFLKEVKNDTELPYKDPANGCLSLSL